MQRTFGANHWRLQPEDTITGLQSVLSVVQARLTGGPSDADDWNTIVGQIRQAERIAARILHAQKGR